MEHGARQNTTRVIAVGFISLGTLLTLSLATNIIQGIIITVCRRNRKWR
jgi:conjugal transfer pilus assembly protein TraE